MLLKKNSKLTNYDFDEMDTSDDDAEVIKKKKKDKAKKKKQKFNDDKIDLLLGFEDEDTITDDEILVMKKPKKGKKDLFDEKVAKKKRKKNIEVKFNPDLTALKKILKDAEVTATDAKAIFDEIKASKVRGVGKFLTDLIQAINTANNTRASIVRQMSTIKKDIIDLQLKQEKGKKGKDEESKSNEDYGNQLFANLFGSTGSSGRKGLKERAREFYNSQDFDEMNEEDTEDYIEDRLNSEDINFRSEDGNKYIQYESENPEDVILYHDNGEWETSAVNKHGQIMPDDYPIIDKENLGKVTFNLDDKKATDEKGRIFRVIEVP